MVQPLSPQTEQMEGTGQLPEPRRVVLGLPWQMGVDVDCLCLLGPHRGLATAPLPC